MIRYVTFLPLALMRKKPIQEFPIGEWLSFDSAILSIYNHTCAISGLRVDTPVMTHLVRPYHIVPYELLPDASAANGIALCPNLGTAFTEGLISLDDEYRVIVSRFVKDAGGCGLTQFHGKRIALPKDVSYYPSLLHIEWHRDEIFFG